VAQDALAGDGPEVLLGRRLRDLRRSRRLSLAEVAEQTGISASFISHIENGKSDMSIGRLMRLADLYGAEPGGATNDAYSYKGELFLYVLDGHVSVSFEQGPTLSLAAGDTAILDPSSPHSFANAGEGPARLLSCAVADDWHQARTSLTRVARRR
jgi:transcriptional regulator with XRE-family HTH domain